MPLTRREAIAGFAGGLALLTEKAAFAQAAYPSRTVKMIVPYPRAAPPISRPPGRRSAQERPWRHRHRREQAGAGTTLGADQVAKAEPDGYTLLMATSTTLAINKTLYKKLPYDPVKDFAPIALVAGVPFALIINPSIPAKTLVEFIAYAKTKPGLSYGSAGNGSPQHLGAENGEDSGGNRHPSCAISRQYPGDARCDRGTYSVHGGGSATGIAADPRGQGEMSRCHTLKRVAAAPDIPTLAEAGLAASN